MAEKLGNRVRDIAGIWGTRIRTRSDSALMEHIGMRREGVFKEELYWNKRWTDQFFYSILDSEYAAQGKTR
ncbi:GNAT family N-acetyltransferase [Paenibacillus thiaminolyticus]|uniref:GNAT family N-acetyltransferase n=1 Tax=Paenibacillus thiaminolyticus TaxID=49283 RepID=UPI002175E459|nr:GNAT family protein [Paenibacillus thiaminolyticus]